MIINLNSSDLWPRIAPTFTFDHLARPTPAHTYCNQQPAVHTNIIYEWSDSIRSVLWIQQRTSETLSFGSVLRSTEHWTHSHHHQQRLPTLWSRDRLPPVTVTVTAGACFVLNEYHSLSFSWRRFCDLDSSARPVRGWLVGRSVCWYLSNLEKDRTEENDD